MLFQSRAARRSKMYRRKGWWTDDTLHSVFDRAAASAPDRVAVIDPPDTETLIGREPERLSYGELAARAAGLTRTLEAMGVKAGDRILAQLPNTSELVLLYLALSRLGAVISPAPMQYGRHEINHAVGELEAKAIVTIGHFKGEPFAGERCEGLPGSVRKLVTDAERPGFELLDMKQTAAPDAVASHGGAEDVLTICWTSGTTGTPKGVPRHHAHWFAQTLAVKDAVPLNEGAVMLNPFPLTNMAALSGFFFFWPQIAGTLALHHPFDLPTFLKQLVQEGVQYTIAPPAVLNMFLQREDLHDQIDLTGVDYIASGSAPLDPWMVKGFKEKFSIEIINFFGSNEGIGLVGGPHDVPDPEMRATVFPRYGDPDFQWSNRFAERFESKLVDFDKADREIRKPGIPGELLIRGPNVFDGYLNERGADDVFTKDGFFRTGDLFAIAGKGEMKRFYSFVGRRKDLIIRGGMNISPEELDGIISEHPVIAECAVAGYADPVMGEKVCLFAVLKPGETLDLDEVKRFLEEKGVAKFKWPERLEIVDALPRNPLGKVVRSELRAQLRQA